LDSTSKRTYTRPERSMRVVLLERLAALYQSGEQTDLAVDAFRQIADVDSDQGARVAAEIVDTYRAGHEFTKAQQEADADLKKWPEDRDPAHRSMRPLLADLGKNDQAIAEVKKLMDGKSDSPKPT